MTKRKTIDEILDSFDENAPPPTREVRPITLWVPLEVKEKYEMIQRRSKRSFSRALREIVELSIERKYDCDDGPSVA